MSEEDKGHIHHHISPLGQYLMVFFGLMFFTWLTVWISYRDLGALNTFVALLIAFMKAGLVVWFFMHLSHSAKVTWVCAVGGLIWLAVMLILTLSDYMARYPGREWIPFPEAWL